MSETERERPASEILPPEPSGAISIPPPVPPKKPGFFRRLFQSRRKQQASALQSGYLELVDLIRAIRSHLDRQETVQTQVLAMLEKVPGAMDRQHEVMTMFQQHLASGMENNRRLTESMSHLNNTLAAMDESQRASSRTITDLIHRSRESEQLLREVMRRAERRMTALVIVFLVAVVALGWYVLKGADRAAPPPPEPATMPAPPATAHTPPVADPPVSPAPAAVAPARPEPPAPALAPATPNTPPPMEKPRRSRRARKIDSPADPREPAPAQPPPPAETSRTADPPDGIADPPSSAP